MRKNYPINRKEPAIFLLFLCLLQAVAFAQTTVNGRIVGEDNLPLGGVSVSNQTLGVTTSADDGGEFRSARA